MIKSPVLEMLERIVAECRALDDGEVADYIPELAKADPAWFGAAVASIDGHVYEVGDTRQEFTIQSISKPFAYGAALDALGPSAVAERVGVEPTGNAFNAIVVDETSHRPFNPMVNAGAIVVAGMLARVDAADPTADVVAMLGRHAGRALGLDTEVWHSERATGDRNRAIAYLMRSLGMLDEVEPTLDRYFAQCSVRVTCHDLALMAATLANGGCNPVTGARAIEEKNVERVLSVMSTCGMYDYAGEWAYAIGLPAKSGVSGGVIAVLPGQLGVGVFSPRLDEHGNSRRGIAVCEALSGAFGLHANRAWSRAESPVRRRYRGHEVHSNRVRTAEQQRLLEAHGGAVAVFELHGDVPFASAERICRAVIADLGNADTVVLDFRRVTTIDEPAIAVLEGLVLELRASGCTVAATNLDATARHARIRDIAGLRTYEDAKAAIGAWEQQLLTVHDAVAAEGFSLQGQELLHGVDAAAVAAIEAVLELQSYEAGEVILRAGERADAICFVMDGEVSVRLSTDEAGRAPRLATFGVGIAFGEAVLLGGTVRTADVGADCAATIGMLREAALDAIAAEHPGTRAAILVNLARVLSRRLQAANAHIQALER